MRKEKISQIQLELLQGQRGLIIGQTGSGKTYFATRLLMYLPLPVFVYNSKDDDTFTSFYKDLIVSTSNINQALELVDRYCYVNYIPPSEELLDKEKQSETLNMLYERQNLSVFFDEVGQVYQTPGFLNILTRGRSRKVTTLMATQRPVSISRFAFTESQKFYVFKIVDKRDREVVSNFIPYFSKDKIQAKYTFDFYNAEDDFFKEDVKTSSILWKEEQRLAILSEECQQRKNVVKKILDIF